MLGLRITDEQDLIPKRGTKLYKHLQCVFDYDDENYEDVLTVRSNFPNLIQLIQYSREMFNTNKAEIKQELSDQVIDLLKIEEFCFGKLSIPEKRSSRIGSTRS